jgi:hypothetical protein
MTGGTRWRLQRHPAPNQPDDGDAGMATHIQMLDSEFLMVLVKTMGFQF